MASVRTLVRIKRGGSYVPPGTDLHGLTAEEVAELAGVVEPIGASVTPGSSLKAVEPVGLPSLPDEEVAIHGAAETVAEVVLDPGEPNPVGDLASAIDLLDEHDWTAAKRPKLVPLAAIFGRKPSGDEITAALAYRAEMEA